MLYSMTGFGKAETIINDIMVQVEIRTLNSKGFDCNIRMPNDLKNKEIAIRNLLSQKLKRGKVDVFIRVETPNTQLASKINVEVVEAYKTQLEEINKKFSQQSEASLDTILKLPNVFLNEEKQIEDDEWKEIQGLIITASDKVNEFRIKEGKTMEKVLLEASESINQRLLKIPQYEQERVEKVKERINAGLLNIVNQQDIDKGRVEQEIIFYIEKFDITEEKVRLAAHLNHLNQQINLEEPIAKGKKLGFISQEIGREINTIGSKANHLEIQKHVVNMKDQLEQIKEQLLNIL